MTAGSGSEAGGQSGSGEAESQTSGEDRCRVTSGGGVTSGVTSDQPHLQTVVCHGTGAPQPRPHHCPAVTDSDTAELCPVHCPDQILGVAKIVFCMR